jgi:hypothetical protein
VLRFAPMHFVLTPSRLKILHNGIFASSMMIIDDSSYQTHIQVSRKTRRTTTQCYSVSTHSVLRFLVWLVWCYAARWSLFHKVYRRSCYASGLYSKAEEDALVVSITSRSNLCLIDLFQHSSIYASLQQEHLGNRIGNSC